LSVCAPDSRLWEKENGKERKKKMIKMMAVYDEDPVYAQRLVDYVNQREKMPFTAMAFSGMEKLEEYAKEHPIEILLVGEKSLEKARELKAGQVMVLCEGELKEVREDSPSIYKYQSGDGIMREVMANYGSYQTEPALAYMGRRSLVHGIYSPINRCMKSSLALTVGQVLSKSMSVLYISLEAYSGFSRLVSADYETDLSDVLYLYRQGNFNWIKLKSMVYTWGSMDFIPPVRYGEDLEQMTPEDLALLIGKISLESGYDRLVIDMGQAGHGSPALLDACDVIYMPVKEDVISAAKLEEFEEYLAGADDGHIQEKIQKVKLPAQKLPVRMEGYMEQLLWGELGDYARRLLGNGASGQEGR
jgi:hypothetical protein